ncbi:hypothetical protein NP493_494g02029 [Ridgeia piscesae]|uniref:Ubiquitin-like protease family profile domain-containing protein n=1 Tax=Ridgeia piscesae TaxID=27915 RepID=A0AAD9KYY7_RIDPI|nr:hypothetical protein NP493_494g02029 [Ridgeia piscesae]
MPSNDSDTNMDNPESAMATSPAVPATPNSKAAPAVVYSVKQPAILIFDSLSGPSRSSVVRTLREYLQVEWDVKKAEAEGPRTFDKDGIRGANPRVPQQTNYSDCGIYILQYVESFFEKPIIDYSIPVKGLADWFPDDRVQKKRAELRELILELQTRLNPDLKYDPTQDGCLSMQAQQ